MEAQKKSIYSHQVRLGLEQLEVSDLVRLFDVTPQRVYQMRSADRDRYVPPAHVETLEKANQAADIVAEFQVDMYRTRGAVSDDDLHDKYKHLLDRLYTGLLSLDLDIRYAIPITETIYLSADEALAKRERIENRERSLAEADWYLRMYETSLGVPPFPPIGKHSGLGFYNLYNIAMRRACERIRAIGGNPLVSIDRPDAFRDVHFEHDTGLWTRTWDVSDATLEAMDDVPAETDRKWKWEFEPG